MVVNTKKADRSQTVVIKLGTSVLTADTKQLDKARIVELIRQCAVLHQAGHKIVIVTSGAIAAGREYLNFPTLPNTVAAKQMLASVGQSKLIQLWEQLFSIYKIHIGQMLLTRADLEDRERFLNAQDALKALLNHQIIPVINENDAVATAEIKVGDNDNLSALVAILAEADKLILLTDIEGLYSADPRHHPDAKLIPVVDHIDDQLRNIAGDSVSGLGTGGMFTKIQAAEIAGRAGIEVVIAAGGRRNVILDIAENQTVGTRFLPQKSPLEHRKYWLFGAPKAGKVTLDDGAVNALIHKGSSLLPSGILTVEHDFSRGAVVDICDKSGRRIARGVTRYNSDALKQIAGHHSQDISQLIGYEHGPVAVHRDDMIVQ
ncbi:glutamate 5-kinase [Orbaceae bacterium ESL0721]|nr:glutamate 5-kinase [Orbaceae bacterium ESL0721]